MKMKNLSQCFFLFFKQCFRNYSKLRDKPVISILTVNSTKAVVYFQGKCAVKKKTIATHLVTHNAIKNTNTGNTYMYIYTYTGIMMQNVFICM